MITVQQTQTLLVAIVIIQTVSVPVWWALARVARIVPRASLVMAGANMAGAFAVGLQAGRGVLPDWLTHLPADLLVTAAFALLRVSVPAIATSRLDWREAVWTWVAGAALLALLPLPVYTRWQPGLTALICAVFSARAGWLAHRLLQAAQPNPRASLLLSLPLFLIAIIMLLRAGVNALAPWHAQGLLDPTPFNMAFLWGALVLAVVQNATLAFLVLMRLVLRIRHLTERDALTEVLNRHAFERALGRAHEALARGQAYALVMIDMDHFKRLNDTLGHPAGDAALRLLVKTVGPCVRAIDRLGRLGGEEFCLLLPATELAGATLVAERMRGLLEGCDFQWEGKSWPLSASFGVAEALKGEASGELVMARADAALYRAKSQGRNVVQAME